MRSMIEWVTRIGSIVMIAMFGIYLVTGGLSEAQCEGCPQSCSCADPANGAWNVLLGVGIIWLALHLSIRESEKQWREWKEAKDAKELKELEARGKWRNKKLKSKEKKSRRRKAKK